MHPNHFAQEVIQWKVLLELLEQQLCIVKGDN